MAISPHEIKKLQLDPQELEMLEKWIDDRLVTIAKTGSEIFHLNPPNLTDPQAEWMKKKYEAVGWKVTSVSGGQRDESYWKFTSNV